VNKHRTSLSLLALSTAAALALTACGSSSSKPASSGSSSGPSSAAAPKAGGSASVGIASSPDSLDPNVASSADDALVMRQIFDSLVTETADHQFKPWLAQSWTVSPDGKQYTFTLKSGVTFQDGTPFNAAAVKTNIDRILAPATKSQYAASLLGTVTSATVVSDNVVRLNLSKPFGPLLEGLSQAFLGMESPAAIQKYGAATANHPVGTGAFSFVSQTPDQQVVLKANASYTSPPAGASHTGPAYLATLTFKVVPESTSRVGALQSKELSAVESIPAEQIASLKKDSSLSVNVVNVPGATYSLYLNEKNAPWDTAAARVALRSGIDVDTIVKTLYFGQYQRAWSVLSPATDGYDASLENSFTYDPSGATKAFEALGYTMGADGYLTKDGKTLSLLMVNNSPDYDKRFEIDTIVQQELKKVGIKDQISDLPFAGYASSAENGKYDMQSFSVTTGSPSVLDTIFNSKNQPDAENFLYNVAHFASPEMDALGAKAASTADTATANGYYKQMQQLVSSTAVAIPIYVDAVTFASQSSLHGVTFDPLTYAMFYDASI
jgi:peptide/nickel transport system substrate-binding protein